jgi:hypothetical protein
MSDRRKRLANTIGVTEDFIYHQGMSGRNTSATATRKLSSTMIIATRFYFALALNEILNEKPLEEVARR